MARLGERVGIVEALAFASVVTAVLATLILLAARWSLEGFADSARQPPWLWIGAVMGLFIVFTITYAGARIGTAATVGILIAGQLAMGAVIDRFGLFGSERIGLGWPRLAGLALLALGAALSLRGR
jgi:transporter family-2 protein